VLVTEIGPQSGAGRAGVRGGDIILNYGGRETRDLATLRGQVAEALASRETTENTGKLLMMVRREGEEKPLILQMPREPLGIRAIEVEAGVAAALNPPAGLRGSFAMEWEKLPAVEETDDAALAREVTWYRLYEGGEWAGYVKAERRLRGTDMCELDLETTHVEVGDGGGGARVVSTTREMASFRMGDQKESPALTLEALEFADSTRAVDWHTSAKRVGARLLGWVQEERAGPQMPRDVGMGLSAVSGGSVRVLAAALPREKGVVLGCSVVSGWDLLPRPGYVLVARGYEPKDDGGNGWRVDLMHCGVVVESYWFSEQRKLLRMATAMGVQRELLKVAGEGEAKASVTTQPGK